VASLLDFFTTNKYTKSINYIKSRLEHKEKWADAYRPIMFTAGTHTTSRAESVNSSIKRYVNSRSELCALLVLIEDMEKGSAFRSSIVSAQGNLYHQYQQEIYEDEALLQSIKPKLGIPIYQKHISQFKVHSQYSMKLLFESNDHKSSKYAVYLDSIPINQIPDKSNTVHWEEDKKVECSCDIYVTEGILCCHVFAVAKMRVAKNIAPFIYKRWRIDESIAQSSLNQFDPKEIDQQFRKELECIKIDSKIEEEKLQVSRFIVACDDESDLETSPINEQKEKLHVPNFKRKTDNRGRKRKEPSKFSPESIEIKDKRVKKK